MSNPFSRASILRDLIKEDEEKDALIKKISDENIGYQEEIRVLKDEKIRCENIYERRIASLRGQVGNLQSDVGDVVEECLCFNCEHADRHAKGECHCNTCCYNCECRRGDSVDRDTRIRLQTTQDGLNTNRIIKLEEQVEELQEQLNFFDELEQTHDDGDALHADNERLTRERNSLAIVLENLLKVQDWLVCRDAHRIDIHSRDCRICINKQAAVNNAIDVLTPWKVYHKVS